MSRFRENYQSRAADCRCDVAQSTLLLGKTSHYGLWLQRPHILRMSLSERWPKALKISTLITLALVASTFNI